MQLFKTQYRATCGQGAIGIVLLCLFIVLPDRLAPIAVAVAAEERISSTNAQEEANAHWQAVLQPVDLAALSELRTDALLYSTAQFEVEARALRERGTGFWLQHPGDPRRYDWLLLTGIVAPIYAEDVSEWRWDNEWLTYVPKARDEEAIRAWQLQYAQMRKEFLGSGQVPEEDKRLLRFIEIWQGMNSRHVAFESSAESRADVVSLVRDFIARHAEMIHPDDKEWVAQRQSIFLEIVYTATQEPKYDLDREEIVELLELGLQAYRGKGISKQLQAALPEGSSEPQSHKQTEVTQAAYWMRAVLPLAMRWPGFERQRAEHPVRIVTQILRNRPLLRTREAGLRLWEASTISEDAIQWYRLSVMYRPEYGVSLFGSRFSDSARVVHEAFERTGELEMEQIGQRLLSDGGLTEQSRKGIEYARAFAMRERAKRAFQSTGDNAVAKAYLDEVYRLYETYGYDVRRRLDIMDRYVELGLDEEYVIRYLSRFAEAPDEDLRRYSQSVVNLLKLRDQPFEFRTKTIDGEPFALSDLRGKIVFIDFWATICGSCMFLMPEKHDIFLEYQDRGVEVLSVGADALEKLPRIRRLIDHHSLTWTTVDGREIWDRMNQEYGLLGFPKYMVLDREGKMVAAPAELRSLEQVRAVIENELRAELL